MCGIIGYIGKDKALPRILSGLKSLEYRGYDSAGIAYVKNKKIIVQKEVGRISNLEKKINLEEDTYMGIGHTRWATHGEANKINSHPHTLGKFTIVHNGIIENYQSLKDELIKKGVKFVSETDTEVIAALLNENYKNEKDILKTILKTTKELVGSYALGIICTDDLEHIYATRCGSPLIMAQDKNGSYIASDVPAILNYTNKYYLLEEKEIAKISSEEIQVFDDNLQQVQKEMHTFEGSVETILLNGYEHFMLKEIHEEDTAFKNTLDYYVQNNKFKETMPDFKKYQSIHIVACGSAYYAGLVSKYIFEEYVNIPVKVELASEYRYQKNFYDSNTLVIIISQSGETADSLASLKMAKNAGIDTLAIVNVTSSSIAREAKYTLYTKAGVEIAVATTKAFIAQVTLLSLVALKMAQREDLLQEFKGIENYIQDLVNRDYLPYAKFLYQNNNIFFIGRGVDYALCLEGSLKLKEAAYINSVALAAGELKHGTISLIEDNTPVISVCTDASIALKTISNIKEVKARKAKVLLITNEDINDNFYDYKIDLPKLHPVVMSIITVIPMQLIAYEVAKLRGCDIDKPRNLAKSVTVE